MSLQWTLVAGFLYVEIVVCFIFLLPWIRPRMWQKLFKSRLAHFVGAYSRAWGWAGAGVLLMFFVDAYREVAKYSTGSDSLDAVMRSGANADLVIHVRLFRAQRNLYISGGALFLWLLLRRLVTLISHEAQLEASAQAAMAQAQSASNAAAAAMDGAGGDDSKAVAALKNQVDTLSKALKAKDADLKAMKEQSEGLRREFDRVSDELNAATAGGDKKSD